MNNLVVIPTYNERGNIQAIISEIRRHDKDIQIMVVDDNSPDGTADAVKQLIVLDPKIILLQRNAKTGLGSAYVEAMAKVRTMSNIDNVITMDADGSHSPEYLSRMLDLVKKYDLVIGSRYVTGGNTENWEWYRKILSSWGNFYSRLILGLKIRDLTAGFMCFRRQILEKLDLHHFDSSGYAYQIEFKYYCVKAGLSATEVPIIFKERRVGHSKISSSIVADGLLIPIRLLLKSRTK